MEGDGVMRAYRVLVDVITVEEGNLGSPFYLEQAIRDGIENDGDFETINLVVLGAELRQVVIPNGEPLDTRHPSEIDQEKRENAIPASE